MPSGLRAPAWRWGSRPSSSSRKPTPRTKPPTAGSQPGVPAASASSMAGMSRLHTDAAIITPAAKPRKMRCTAALSRARNRKTMAAPVAVIRKVKPVPTAAHRIDCIKPPNQLK